jgi:glutathione synthase/RimK-type ligase-like ATP-grasp enzyme
MSYHFAVLKNETATDHLEWIEACESSREDIAYEVVDISKQDWLDNVKGRSFVCLLTRPPGNISYFKQLYEERVYILHKVLGYKIYPRFEEILIHENKRFLSYWLDANDIPHPKTWVFYHKDEALRFLESCSFPIVAKTSIGASGSGIRILRNRQSLKSYLGRAFSSSGIIRQWGPNLRAGGISQRLATRLKNIPAAVKFFRQKRASRITDPQKMHIILQEYVKCDFEWRVVRIGESYFAHKKLRRTGELISGTSRVSWDGPSDRLLDFVKGVCDRGEFLSQAVDIFEDEGGRFLVNEMHCFFGSKNPHQMILNGKPGRYVLVNSQWKFEEGVFNTHNSFDLRLNHVIQLLNRNEL